MRVVRVPGEGGEEIVSLERASSPAIQVPAATNPTSSATTTQYQHTTTQSQSRESTATLDSSTHHAHETLFDAEPDEADDPVERHHIDQNQNRDEKVPWMNSHRYRQETECLPPGTRCALLPMRPAVWMVAETNVKLSALGAAILMHEGKLSEEDLEIFREDELENLGPTDPISGLVAAVHSTVGGVAAGIIDYPVEISKMVHSDHEVAKHLATDFALDSGKGISRIIGTGLKAPMVFTSNVSKGFANLPRLYGDEVRKEEKVTGIESGLEGAVKGLGYGLFDGITGLVTQPMKGAQEGGVGGFFMGLGKGIGGAVFKPAAGALNVPASAFKGIYEEIQSARGLSERDQKFAAQIKQGEEEWEMCSVDERAAILGMWYDDV